jgi:hypothetical protein
MNRPAVSLHTPPVTYAVINQPGAKCQPDASVREYIAEKLLRSLWFVERDGLIDQLDDHDNEQHDNQEPDHNPDNVSSGR